MASAPARSHAKKVLPPGPGTKDSTANLLAIRRDPLKFLSKLHEKYGDVVYFKLGPQDSCLVASPELIKGVLVDNDWNFLKGRGLQRAKKLLGNGLLTAEGNFHRRQRRLAQPAFHKQRIAGYAETMVQYTLDTRERWRDGETVDMAKEMMRLTLAIVAKTLFDADVESDAKEVGDALTEALELFDIFASPLSEILEKFPLPRNKRFKLARQRLDETIYRFIDDRRASGVDKGDLLSMLMLAQDTEDGSGGMADEQLHDEALTLFLAGHETTANALTWTWYLLSQHPEIEARLHNEIDSVLDGRAPTMDDVPKLSYTEMVLTEAMRVYPPVWVIGRRAVSSYKIAGYDLPAKTVMFLSQWVMHHDERYFPEPYTFDPNRWTSEATAGRPKHAYFPFGGGPRLCIGEQFAWMEGILIIAGLAQKYVMRLVPGHKVVPQPLITLRPKYGMKMRIERR